jgi:hypothetical protein
VEVGLTARLSRVSIWLEGPQYAFHVAFGQRPLVIAGNTLKVEVAVGGQ